MDICLTTRSVHLNALVSLHIDTLELGRCAHVWVAKGKGTKVESVLWIHQTFFFLLQVMKLSSISKAPVQLGGTMWQRSSSPWPGYRPISILHDPLLSNLAAR